MPLKRGKSKKAVADNISKAVGESYPQNQAIAMALAQARGDEQRPMRRRKKAKR